MRVRVIAARSEIGRDVRRCTTAVGMIGEGYGMKIPWGLRRCCRGCWECDGNYQKHEVEMCVVWGKTHDVAPFGIKQVCFISASSLLHALPNRLFCQQGLL